MNIAKNSALYLLADLDAYYYFILMSSIDYASLTNSNIDWRKHTGRAYKLLSYLENIFILSRYLEYMEFFRKATRKVEETLDPDVEKTEFLAILGKIRDDVKNRRMKPRTSIYLNESRLLNMLSQCFKNFNQYASVYELSGQSEGKVSVLVAEVKGGITSKEGRTVQENIRPLIAAWILEHYANKNGLLADIPDNGVPNGPFYAILEGFIVSEEEIRNKQNFPKISKIDDMLLTQIEDKLLNQAKRDKTETLAWIRPSPTKTLASILDRKFVADDNYMSYEEFAPLGFFGLAKPEISTQEVVYLSPLWIWQER